jgi:beta-glucosidase
LGNLLGPDSTSISASFTCYAADTEVCLIFINVLAGEGADRTELRNTVQDGMVSSVAVECNNTIVVIQTVGARLVDNWISNENITAVLYSSLLRQESGNSVVDVLYGDVNLSRRLVYTIAKTRATTTSRSRSRCRLTILKVNKHTLSQFDCVEIMCKVQEITSTTNTSMPITLLHDTHLAMASHTHLSTTPPSLSHPSTTSNLSTYPTGIPSVGGNSDPWTILYNVSLTISNTGSLNGAEVPQLYISFPDEAEAPLRQL